MENKKMLSEAYAVLRALGNEYTTQISRSLLDYISNERDKFYLPYIKSDIPLNKQAISKDTLIFLAMIKKNFWQGAGFRA